MKKKAVIWKYKFSIWDEMSIEMPKGAIIISIQIQNGQTVLWAIVNPDEKEKELRRFRCFPTGSEFDLLPDEDCLTFLSTIQLAGGDFVIHCFEIVKRYPEGVKEVYFGEGK